MKYNYLDLFSGIGGFHEGLGQAGFEFGWTGHAELDAHAKSIYSKHFPDSEDLGSVTGIRIKKNGIEIRRRYKTSRFIPVRVKGTCWIITGGWPCQDNSIAGKRKGQVGGTRSGLFDQIIRVISEFLAVGADVIFVGENVKGLYSVNNGMDFINTITRFADLDTGMPQLNIQNQLLNTRWFLPQNRERIYFVGSVAGRSRLQVFPIREGGQRIAESQGEAQGERQRVWSNNSSIAGSLRVGGGDTKDLVHARTVSARYGKDGSENLIQVGNVDTKGHNSLWGRVYSPEGDSATLNAKGGGMGAKTGLYEVKAVQTVERSNKKQNGRQVKEPGEPMFTLDSTTHGIEIAPCMRANHHNTADVHFIEQTMKGCCNLVTPDAYITKGERKRNSETGKAELTSMHKRRIRRLTPVECARLQGFPDNWASHGKDGQIISDSQQYKCYGNAVSVPVVKAIGERILKNV